MVCAGAIEKKAVTVGHEVTKELREIRDRVNKLLDLSQILSRLVITLLLNFK